MSPEERFAAVDRMASQLFGTERWKTLFADRYDISRQAVGKWAHNGAPVWACVALCDALEAAKLERIRQELGDVAHLEP
jgi:hypothetical protein